MELFTSLDHEQEECIGGGQGGGATYIAVNTGNLNTGSAQVIGYNRLAGERLKERLKETFGKKNLGRFLRLWLTY